ncbi:MAG: DUF4118 domain-containing protein, partial [Acidobacteria bacterium]|nr:DUF4118 domain-containing protein [Acidobacteriota bacterium]
MTSALFSEKDGALRAIRLTGCVLIVGAVTGLLRLTAVANTTTVALSFLMVVLAIAAGWGLLEAVVASFLSTLSFNYYFLPPVGTFSIADPANWVALSAFLVVSIVASQLSEKARRTARDAVERQEEMEQLYTLSRMILMLTGNTADVAGEAPRLIQQTFGAANVVLFHSESGEIYRAGESAEGLTIDRLKEIVLQGNVVDDAARNLIALPVSLGGKGLGSLCIVGAKLSDGARQAVVNLLAIALESAKSRETAGRAELAMKSEEFKGTLLDALAHELKTPLTSLKTAVSVLAGPAAPAATHREMLTIAEEEIERLNRLISEILQMARLDAGKLRLNKVVRSVEEMIREAVEGMGRNLDGREVQILVASDLPPVFADSELIRAVLNCLLDNAAKYSPPGKRIRVAAEKQDEEICVSVSDEGAGLSEEELSRVFEKYYRGANSQDLIPGMGMVLAIARDIVS